MDAVDRRAAVLRAIVEEYVQTAQPVASQTIAQSRSLGVSSATVRNDMTQLEREGYIVQPHTSAGRIPTDQGYRYFVDHFTKAGSLPVGQRRAVAEFFASAHSALEDLLHETSQLLARLTEPRRGRRRSAVRRRPGAQRPARSTCSPSCVLAVAVLSNGSIEKEVISNAGDFDDDQIARASADARRARSASRRSAASPGAAADGRPGGRPAGAARRRGAVPARRVRRRAAVRRWREPDRRRAGRVRHRRAGVAPARDARAAGRRGVARPRPARPGRHGQHRLRERRRRAARLLARARAVPASTARRPAPSACSARPGWTTSRRWLRWPRSRSSSAGSCSAESRDAHRPLRAARRRPERDRRRDQARVPPARPRAPPRREPATRPPRRTSRRSPARTRRCAIPSAVAATTCSATTGAAAAAAQGPGEAFGFGDLFDAFFSGGFGGGAAGPPRAPDAEAVIELDLVRGRVRHRRETLELAAAERVRPLRRIGLRAGHAPEPLRHVRRRGRGAPGPALDARPARDRGAVRRVRRDRAADPEPVQRRARGDGRVRATRHIDVEVPAGIDDGQRLRLTGRGPAAPRSGVPGDLYVTVRVRPHPTLERQATTSCTSAGSR